MDYMAKFADLAAQIAASANHDHAAGVVQGEEQGRAQTVQGEEQGTASGRSQVEGSH